MASSVKKRRVIVLADETLIPPDNAEKLPAEERDLFKTEQSVIDGLKALGHELRIVGVSDELAPLRKAIDEFKPHIVFNLLEEFQDKAIYDAHIVSYLELRRTPYTGCNPRGLVLARDKALSKKILTYHRIKVPGFMVFPRHRKRKRPKHLEFPLIVKSLIEEGSYGIAQASVVHNDEALEERVKFIHSKIKTDALVEQYIKGREIYASVLGNHRLQVLPPWEIFLDDLPDDAAKIATRKVKWDLAYQQKYNVRIGEAKDLPEELASRIGTLAKRICRRLGTDGCVRIDFRLDAEGELHFLEANPNPDIGQNEEFAGAAAASGLSYPMLLQRIINLGIRRAEKG